MESEGQIGFHQFHRSRHFWESELYEPRYGDLEICDVCGPENTGGLSMVTTSKCLEIK